MTEKAPEFYSSGMDRAEMAESILRYNASEARVFDHSNNTVVVTRELLLSSAAEIARLTEVLREIANSFHGGEAAAIALQEIAMEALEVRGGR